jgi:hypothetical protein
MSAVRTTNVNSSYIPGTPNKPCKWQYRERNCGGWAISAAARVRRVEGAATFIFYIKQYFSSLRKI